MTIDYDEDNCPVCGAPQDLESCWNCLGAGGFHDCGADICTCLDPDELTAMCVECDGTGESLVCMAAPHTDAQRAAYRQRLQREG